MKLVDYIVAIVCFGIGVALYPDSFLAGWLAGTLSLIIQRLLEIKQETKRQ